MSAVEIVGVVAFILVFGLGPGLYAYFKYGQKP